MKAYIIKKVYNNKLAIVCYLNKCNEDFLSWILYCDYNNTIQLFDRIEELKRNNYKIEFINNVEEDDEYIIKTCYSI